MRVINRVHGDTTNRWPHTSPALGTGLTELATIEVNEAPTLKRYRARAKGRGTRIIKRNSHITINVGDE